MLDLAPDRVTVPTLGAVWRSILGAADFSVFVYGATGRFKTALASLLQQHFGTGFAADRLPGSWASTANFNEVLAFIAKDALLVIGLHRRTPGIVADLFIGWQRFLDFASEAEALTRSEAEGHRARVWSALIEVARRQSEHQREANPVDRFLALLRTAIAAGRAHVAARDGGIPDDPGTRGWCSSRPARNPGRAEWLPQGARVGWLDGQDLLLDIDSAYRAAQVMARDGDGIAIGVQPLAKRLFEAGWLKNIDERRGKLKVRRMIDGKRLEVLHLSADVLKRSL